jgi:homoserine dehydrogenase
MKNIQIGIIGLGTVGTGVYKVLKRNQTEIVRRAGCDITISMVSRRDTAKAHEVVDTHTIVTDNPQAIIDNPDIDIVVELIGGCTVAKELVLAAIHAGKHVITANKALLAIHGEEIFAAAKAANNGLGVMVAYEAAVAGGIPIIKALREGLSANHIEWVAGIINGTTNFILSEMRDKGLSFTDVLKQAQALGYAEADPTFDIEGIDAAHKASLLSAIAFGTQPQFLAMQANNAIEGITQLTAQDIIYAEQLGYRIKLLGISKRTTAGIELRVHPTLIPAQCLIANVEGAMNAVLVKGDAVGATLYYGKGAGSEPTASAVIADIIDVVRTMNSPAHSRVPVLAFQDHALNTLPIVAMNAIVTSYYLRIPVLDAPGVLAKIATTLANTHISIDALLQRESQPNLNINHEEHTDIIVLTHEAREGDMLKALSSIRDFSFMRGEIVMLRKESLT